MSCGLDSASSGLVPVAGSLEHGTEVSVSTEGGQFLDQLSDISLSRKTLLQSNIYLFLTVSFEAFFFSFFQRVKTIIFTFIALFYDAVSTADVVLCRMRDGRVAMKDKLRYVKRSRHSFRNCNTPQHSSTEVREATEDPGGDKNRVPTE
jgi:hypothetical protein